MPKRRLVDEVEEEDNSTPRKIRRGTIENAAPTLSNPLRGAQTPSRPTSILKETPRKGRGLSSVEATPSSLRKVLFATPYQGEDEANGDGEVKINGDDEDTPTANRNHNDHSARKKSQRTLQKQILPAEDSDNSDAEREEVIAHAILGEDDEADEIEIDAVEPGTPSKTGRPRGRPKGRRRERTPTPPPDLPPHELYFFQNRAGGTKTSANTLPSHVLLNNDEYIASINANKDPHSVDIDVLKQLHWRAYHQWVFELEEGFNVCLYGYGSKRHLAMEFAEHIYFHAEPAPKIVVVNGYTPGLTIRDVLAALATVVIPKDKILPAQPTAALELLLAALTDLSPPGSIKLIVHSLDHPTLRKTSTQTLFAQLAAHPSISLVATCDTPTFPLLWDVSLSSQFRFLFHDATTFAPYTAEIDVVEDVNALLGRSSRRLGGKDGVGYVLRSLPENARSLFRILVAEQLALADAEGDTAKFNGFGDDSDPEDVIGLEDEEAAAAETPSRRKRGRPAKTTPKAKILKHKHTIATGVEYRTLYHKAVEEFVCSSEVNFRTLLKEFHDHQMIESRTDALGTERLVVPFRTEELESILHELIQ